MAKFTEDALDAVIMEVLRHAYHFNDRALRRRLEEEFPDVRIPALTNAWDWVRVEHSLMRLRDRGLVTAIEDYRGRLVNWTAVNPLDALSEII